MDFEANSSGPTDAPIKRPRPACSLRRGSWPCTEIISVCYPPCWRRRRVGMMAAIRPTSTPRSATNSYAWSRLDTYLSVSVSILVCSAGPEHRRGSQRAEFVSRWPHRVASDEEGTGESASGTKRRALPADRLRRMLPIASSVQFKSRRWRPLAHVGRHIVSSAPTLPS